MNHPFPESAYVIHLFLNIATTMEMKTYANEKHLALLGETNLNKC